ncbi:MAG: transcription-repair coupling factor [Thermodesulfobacteriota bacterium]
MNDKVKVDSDLIHSWIDSEAWKKGTRIGFTGLATSSKAYLLSHWMERGKGPSLIIVPHLRRGELFLDDFLFFKRRKEHLCLLFPQWETLPYDEIPAHPKILRERINCLFSLLKGEDVLVISTIKALMQKVLPPPQLKNSVLSLSMGKEVDRDLLIQYLHDNGYSRVSVVEEVGEVSIRGGIIDLYTPLYEDPLRFEFIGDQLESIRRFEIESQRSLPQSQMSQAILLPASDLLKDFSNTSLASLFDYLNEDRVIFIEDGEVVEREAELFYRLITERYEKVKVKKRAVPPPESIYLSVEEVSQALRQFRTIFLEEGPIAPVQCQTFFFFGMESNEDLKSEMKTALSSVPPRSEESPFSIILKRIQDWQAKGFWIMIVSHTRAQADRLKDLLSHYGVKVNLGGKAGFQVPIESSPKEIQLLYGPLSKGFKNFKEGWIIITEEEVFGERRRLNEKRDRARPPEIKGAVLSSRSELRENDFVVHLDYGVGIYKGLRHLKIGGVSNDYLLLQYHEGDKLYVPVDRLNLIQRYIGGDGRPPRLDKLGSRSWERAKKRAKAAVSEMIKELIDLYAQRQVFQGTSFSPLDQFYKEFEATFEYEETPDQARAIQEVMEDMGAPKPMDRLICGDVGYGKTEVAIRAAYRAVMDGKQVAILVPTTILAQQHLQTFRNRFRAYPVVIEMLSRFKSPREQKEIIQGLKEGRVDIVIGTHRLLQKDVGFRDLGLVVIDEEHRFGVIHKEKLKQLRRLVDVITLTATPIPRTLQMAISGIRDLSLIQTAPENRLSIRTFVVRYDDQLIREAIQRELARGGQVFFVHHRVQNIHAMANHLKRLVPEASLAIAHGQMNEKELEKVMFRFVRGDYNLLVCTNIIESGLDIPSVNTILINHAEQFGLADLYQLRGRVGRGSHQAYAYLLVPSELSLSPDAIKRFRAIQELSELGSGFKLALHDLEIRGAGNLLGPSQSGHISSIGLELYTQMMEKAIRELKGEEVLEEITPEIHFHLPAFIPESYVTDTEERLSLYRRLSLSRSEEEVEMMREELLDRFGKLPIEVIHLLEVIKVKLILTRLRIKKLEETPSQLVLTFDQTTPVSPQRVVHLINQGKGRYRLTPDSKLVIEGWPNLKKDPFGETRKLLQAMA